MKLNERSRSHRHSRLRVNSYALGFENSSQLTPQKQLLLPQPLSLGLHLLRGQCQSQRQLCPSTAVLRRPANENNTLNIVSA